MKAKIKIVDSFYGYGFGKDWCLVLQSGDAEKIMFLGQDTKVCLRLLQMDASDVVRSIGTRLIDEGTKGNKKLTKLILDTLKNNHNISKKDIWKMNNWELCVQ